MILRTMLLSATENLQEFYPKQICCWQNLPHSPVFVILCNVDIVVVPMYPLVLELCGRVPLPPNVIAQKESTFTNIRQLFFIPLVLKSGLLENLL
jgi:hypothetical protein